MSQVSTTQQRSVVVLLFLANSGRLPPSEAQSLNAPKTIIMCDNGDEWILNDYQDLSFLVSQF